MPSEGSELQKPVEPLSSQSLSELSSEVKKEISLYRSSNDGAPRSSPIAAVHEPACYTSRSLSDPIAAVEICPAYPEYMIVGTYALLKPDASAVSVTQVRTGSVSVLPLAATFKPAYPGAAPPLLGESCLGAAVLDIHFHPSDDTLVGVATSDARMTFFRLIKLANVVARRVEMHLVRLGGIEVAEPNDHGEIPLITSFCWLPGLVTVGRTGRQEADEYREGSFAVSISNGGVRCLRARIPTPSATKDAPQALETRPVAIAEVAQHTEEAWTVAASTISTPNREQANGGKVLILSGGDDSALIAAILEATTEEASPGEALQWALPASHECLDTSDRAVYSASLSTTTTTTTAPHHLWTDRKTHTAGVVAILPLSSYHQPNCPALPVLTGSYDEHIRLFLLETTSPILKRSLVLEQKLGGGVWRLKLMHESTLASTSSSQNMQYTALILASCMHGGVRILRLTHTCLQYSNSTSSTRPASHADTRGWQLHILAKFTQGHESMNYGSDFRREHDDYGRCTGEYTVVSTSFYDKALCVWKFVDDKKDVGK